MSKGFKVLGHPVHPMLVVFPFGLLATGVIFDLLNLFIDNDAFPVVSFWMIAAGILGGLLAAVFGLIDWLAIPGGTRAKRIGLWHGAGNVVIVVMFAISWLLRRDLPDYSPSGLPLILELVGAGLALVTGWLGGELVYRLGVGVDEGARPDAPSSLTSGSAAASSTRQPPP
jgi:uncharacterized membrane protein